VARPKAKAPERRYHISGQSVVTITLEVGKRADLVILDKDPLKVDPNAIKDIKVVQTIKDGVTIFPPPVDFDKPLNPPSKYAGMSYMWRAHVCDMAEVNQAAAQIVRHKFLGALCRDGKVTWFFMGTHVPYNT
jgi:hypothetical protein